MGEDLQWSVSGEELDAANGLGVSLSDLREIVTDLFHHPGKYVEVTRQIIDIYSFEAKKRTPIISKANDL